jgi:hypothetical protein
MEEKELKGKIVSVLKEQGFRINPHVRPTSCSKQAYRNIQRRSRLEQIAAHRDFLKCYFEKAKQHCRDGKDIVPSAISLELREVKTDSLEENLFRWWNLAWWTIPYQRPYGRQMRFLVWDTAHDCPFGLIGLQSPVLKMSVRDKALEIPASDLDIWVNKSMNAQRIGALPPYNELLGGKMVALALTANEIRDAYRQKYADYKTLIKGRTIGTDLLFITTTSAFGRSSLYNRLKYHKELVAQNLGYTQGSGSFHIPQELYLEIVQFLADKGIDVSRGYGHGPSRKLKLLSLAFGLLGLRGFEFHAIRREFYLFPLVSNLKEVIKGGEQPQYVDRPLNVLVDYWKERWALPRAERKLEWKDFTVRDFFEDVDDLLNSSEVAFTQANAAKLPEKTIIYGGNISIG